MVENASVAVRTGRAKWALWTEFMALYLLAPLVMALFLPPDMLFPALFGVTIVGLVLLWQTGGFRWRSLFTGWRQVDWSFAILFALGVGLLGWGIMRATQPEYIRALTLPRVRFLALIWLLYPILSALPQELVFRPLFFYRYGALFPDPRSAALINAAIFSFAHLMYWSVIVAILTFAGGLVFAWAYQRRGFVSAWLLHSLAGNMLFAVGMGYYFWSGNVVRPF